MKAGIVHPLALLALSTALSACGCLTSCSTEPAPEKLLGRFIPRGEGGFTHRWLAYILTPEEGAADQSLYVEVNGQRLGPYSKIGKRFAESPDGEHIAFAAKKDGSWRIVLDGEERWKVDGLGWAWYAWTPDLEGNIIVPQSKAPIMSFSYDGERLAYMVGTESTGWAIHVNGKPGPSFQDIYLDLSFVGDQVAYRAETDEGQVFVLGRQTFGPYDTLDEIQYSRTGEHFAFYAEKAGRSLLVVDGKEESLSNKPTDLQVGPAGEIAYAIESDGQTSVSLKGHALTETYDDVRQLTISPDGNHVAFWGRRGSSWLVVTDSAEFSGFDGSPGYSIVAGGIERTFSILWDKSSKNVAYFAEDGDRVLLALNGNEMLDWQGGPPSGIDREALVECLLRSDDSACPNSPTSKLIRGALAYVEKGEGMEYVVVGEKREGPFDDVASGLLRSADREHYAYFVRNEQGLQVVLDGEPMERVYEDVFRPSFVGKRGFSHLGKKDGQVYSVYYSLPS